MTSREDVEEAWSRLSELIDILAFKAMANHREYSGDDHAKIRAAAEAAKKMQDIFMAEQRDLWISERRLEGMKPRMYCHASGCIEHHLTGSRWCEAHEEARELADYQSRPNQI